MTATNIRKKRSYKSYGVLSMEINRSFSASLSLSFKSNGLSNVTVLDKIIWAVTCESRITGNRNLLSFKRLKQNIYIKLNLENRLAGKGELLIEKKVFSKLF